MTGSRLRTALTFFFVRECNQKDREEHGESDDDEKKDTKQNEPLSWHPATPSLGGLGFWFIIAGTKWLPVRAAKENRP